MMVLTKRSGCSLLSIVTFVLFLSPTARGDYILRTRVHSYSNPTNQCFGCSSSGGARSCCDGFQEGVQCIGATRCDNEFFTCVRPLWTPRETRGSLLDNVTERSVKIRARALQCLQPPAPLRSDTNTDGGFIDFTGPMFLRLPNPIEFQIDASEWRGIQFYLDVVDRDDFTDPEIVESFSMDIRPQNLAAGRGMTEEISFFGIFRISIIRLSFEVVCLPGFVGETCVPICSTDPCSNNGTCLQSGSGFTCACRGDFTGETCETRINDCQDVDCNGGTCVDGVQSFTCQCEEGFTGNFCEQRSITTTSNIAIAITSSDAIPTSDAITAGDVITNDTGADTGAEVSSSINVGAVIGAVIGGSISIFAIVVVAVVLLLQRVQTSSSEDFKGTQTEENSPILDNPVYDSMLPHGEIVDDERELDNPIYDGLQDANIYDMLR